METPTLPVNTIIQLLATGVFDRFPNLRLLFGETHIGWLPFWLEQIDDRYDRHRFWVQVNLRMRPSDYVRNYCRFVFLEDHIGVNLRHDIGVDMICWSNDFPHAVGDWPWSQEVIARQFKDVPNDERRRVLALNAAEWMRVITAERKSA